MQAAWSDIAVGDDTRTDARRDGLYREAVEAHGAALERLARAYEADAERRRDLVQDIHLEVWRSFGGFDGRCSMRTWVYRVAHNVGASHVAKDKRRIRTWVGLEDLAESPDADNPEETAGERHALARLTTLIAGLKPIDRQVMLLYLEDLEAAAIAEISGLSPGAVAVKIHRIKGVLARRFAPPASGSASHGE